MHAQPTQEAKRVDVSEQQKPIAAWVQSIMDLKGWSAPKFAKEAGLSKDTVYRALNEDYAHATSTTTLTALAKAAGVPPPIHLLVARSVPSVAALTEVFRELLTSIVPERDWPQEVLTALGRGLRHTLLEFAEHGDGQDDPARAGLVARIASRKLRDEDS